MRRLLLLLGLIGITVWSAAALPPASLSRALAAQEEVVAKSPGDAGVYNDYGNLLLLADREDEARAAYERAVELDPDLLSARYNLALLLERQDDLRGATAQLEAIVERAPRHAWAHYQLGRIAERQGRRHGAIKHYARAFQLDTRLSFPDVNPSVIDSELVTEALLKIPEGVGISFQTPRIYEDPGRIAGLLLPRLSEQREASFRQAGSPEPDASGSKAGDALKSPVQRSWESTQGSILDAGDLDPDSKVGEATPAFTPREPYGGGRHWSMRGGNSSSSGSSREVQPGSRSTGQSRLQIRDEG